MVYVDWDDSSEPDLASYSVYRATTSGGPYTLQMVVTNSFYADTAVSNGMTYYYVLTATDTSGNESSQRRRSQCHSIGAERSRRPRLR